MQIELSNRNIPCSLQEQAAKVTEEWAEFILAQIKEPDPDRVAEEAFDLMESLVRYMDKLGIDVQKANERHLEKMCRREEEARTG